MSGKPCIHCGAHVNYFSGSNCDVGHLHRACRKEIQNQKLSDRGEPLSTYSEVGDATKDVIKIMEEGRQDNPISTDEHSQDLERDLGDQNQANDSKGSNALVSVAKFGVVILLLCAVGPIAGFALVAIVFSGGAPEIIEAAVTFGVILLLVVLAIMGSKKWGLAIGVIALLVLSVTMGYFF